MEDFAEKGFVSYTSEKLFWDRAEGMQFKTPSGKIEFRSSLLENAGFESFPPYASMSSPPPPDQFRLITGRQALHTHVSTQNNMYLNEITPENEIWINRGRAEQLGIRNHDLVRVSSSRGSGTIRAHVTDLIHPEAAFMLHGFGRDSKLAARSYRRGVSDSLLQENITDVVGGSPALHHTFVTVTPA
jgi:thiosulfate reductase/polysulfide reductase chain A